MNECDRHPVLFVIDDDPQELAAFERLLRRRYGLPPWVAHIPQMSDLCQVQEDY